MNAMGVYLIDQTDFSQNQMLNLLYIWFLRISLHKCNEKAPLMVKPTFLIDELSNVDCFLTFIFKDSFGKHS